MLVESLNLHLLVYYKVQKLKGIKYKELIIFIKNYCIFLFLMYKS